jgi:hypothetical protein
MNHLALIVRKSLLAIAVIAESLGFLADAGATGPVAPPADKPVSLSVTPVHVYRSPSIVGDFAAGVRPEARIRRR